MIERNDRTNWSTLKAMSTSPRHYLSAVNEPRTDTPAMQLGRLVHAMLLEPDTVAARYAAMPRYHGGMNDATAIAKGFEGGKQAKQAWTEEHAETEIVPADTMVEATAMVAFVEPDVRVVLEISENEVDLEWTDPDTGIECRGRVDSITPNRVIDVKTTRNIAPHAFGRDAARMLYHAQLAWYHDGLAAARGDSLPDLPAIVAIENSAPYDSAVYMLTQEHMDAGRRVYKDCLARLKRCRDTDTWPGVGSAPSPLMLPGWAVVDATPEPITVGGVEVF